MPCEELSKTIEKSHYLLTLVDGLCRCLPCAQSVKDSLTLSDELCRLLRCADFCDSQSRKRYRKDTHSGIANQAAWEWGLRIGSSRKWLQKGAKGLLDPESQSLPKVSCAFQTLFCTGATRSFAPVQEAFRSTVCNPLLSTFGNFLFATPSPKRLGLQFLVCLDGHLSAPLVPLQEHEHPI